MIVEPRLLYTPVFDESEETVDASEAAVDLPAEEDTEGYPVALLSERFLRTFNEAHRVVNIPAAGVASLNRFRASNRNRSEGEDEGIEPVGEQHGGGKTSK